MTNKRGIHLPDVLNSRVMKNVFNIDHCFYDKTVNDVVLAPNILSSFLSFDSVVEKLLTNPILAERVKVVIREQDYYKNNKKWQTKFWLSRKGF